MKGYAPADMLAALRADALAVGFVLRRTVQHLVLRRGRNRLGINALGEAVIDEMVPVVAGYPIVRVDLARPVVNGPA